MTTEPPGFSDLANSPTEAPPTVSRTRLSFFPSRASSISLCRLPPWRTTRSPPHSRTCSAASSRRTTFSVLTPASFASSMMYCPHGRVGCGLTDPVARHQGNIPVQQKVGRSGVNPYHRQLQGICFVAHWHDVTHWDYNLICPGALLVGRDNQDSLTLQSNINLRSDLGDSADTLRPYRGWEGRPDTVLAADEQKVRWVERGRFHRDEDILGVKSRFGDRVEFD